MTAEPRVYLIDRRYRDGRKSRLIPLRLWDCERTMMQKPVMSIG
jgi:hypothetical protein